MSTKTRAERVDEKPWEPRCRICRHSDVRRVVNDLLDWPGVHVILEGGNKRDRINYTDILGMLKPLNEGRDKRDRITYDSLWVHAKRHYRPCRNSGLLANPVGQRAEECPEP